MDKVRFNTLFKEMDDRKIISQISSEIEWVVSNVEKMSSLKVIVEIGVATGGSIKLWDELLKGKDGGLLIGISADHICKWDIEKEGQAAERYYLYKHQSEAPETIARVKEILGDRKIDFLFIDGDHTYNGVKSDWENYSPLVRDGGLIGMHDIQTDPLEIGRAWAEIIGYKKEIKNNGIGTGLVWKKEN